MSPAIASVAAWTGSASLIVEAATKDGWTFMLAFSFFRLAAICQGVYKRALDGNASNPEKARLYSDTVAILAGLAVGLVEVES